MDESEEKRRVARERLGLLTGDYGYYGYYVDSGYKPQFTQFTQNPQYPQKIAQSDGLLWVTMGYYG